MIMKNIHVAFDNDWYVYWYFSTRKEAVEYIKENREELSEKVFIKEAKFIS